MPKIVSRADSGLRAPRSRSTGVLNRKSTGHWNGPTLTIRGSTEWGHELCAGIVRGIQAFHMDVRKWNDIAYNFVICPHDYIFEGRGLNVINAANGTNEGNRTSHAVMWMTGQGNPFVEGEKRGFRGAVAYISDNTSAPDDAIGHRDHKSTECPGDERYRWIHDGMPVSGSTPTPVPTPEPIDEEEEDVRQMVRAPSGEVFVFDGIRLNRANNQKYQDILRFSGAQGGPNGEPWTNWTQEQIDAVPKVG